MNKEVIDKLNDLYVLLRRKFLIMDKNGEYSTYPTNKNLNAKLTDKYLWNHLKQYCTVGVFAGSIFTKFICFDVDVKNKELAKWAVYKLFDTLQNMGIPNYKIYISMSGSKGYHVEIFFDKPVFNEDVNKFYLMVLNTAELLNIDYGKVELRPTNTQGVKIPLGKHFKSGNICWYVEYDKSLKPIKDYNYILSIQKMDTQIFYNILNKYDDDIDLPEKKIEEFENIVGKHKNLTIYKENVDPDITIDAIIKLISEGLTMTGTRHNSLLKIAKYYKHINLSQKDAKNNLIDWLSQQDKKMMSQNP